MTKMTQLEWLLSVSKLRVGEARNVEDDNASCVGCGQGYDSDARDNCPHCGYEYRYEKCEGVADDAGS